jgi:hypothetical protein
VNHRTPKFVASEPQTLRPHRSRTLNPKGFFLAFVGDTASSRTVSEGFRSIENKKFPMKTNKNKPRSDLRDEKQRAREIRSTYPCRSHSGNIQMNMVGIVVLASNPRDPIRSKRHNGRRLRALHTYSAATTLPSRSNEIWRSGRWD